MWSGLPDLNRGPPARKASHGAARATGPSEENRQEIDKSAVCRRWRAAKSLKGWWTAGGSNPRPPDCEPGALPAELAAQGRTTALYRVGQGVSTRFIPQYLQALSFIRRWCYWCRMPGLELCITTLRMPGYCGLD